MPLFLEFFTRMFGGKRVISLVAKNIKAVLDFIKDWSGGSFRAVIDRIYIIDKIAEAYKYVATGQKTGNVVIIMDAYVLQVIRLPKRDNKTLWFTQQLIKNRALYKNL